MPLSNEERKAMVLARKGLQARIARKLGMSENHVGLVISGEREGSERVKREIARRLRLSVHEVFPSPVPTPDPGPAASSAVA